MGDIIDMEGGRERRQQARGQELARLYGDMIGAWDRAGNPAGPHDATVVLRVDRAIVRVYEINPEGPTTFVEIHRDALLAAADIVRRNLL